MTLGSFLFLKLELGAVIKCDACFHLLLFDRLLSETMSFMVFCDVELNTYSDAICLYFSSFSRDWIAYMHIKKNT